MYKTIKMKKITLKQLVLTNFKGIKSLSIDFDPITTVISGENGTGKTTVYDAFNFLLFGKDSSDRKDFNIKTLDKYNNPIHKLNHEVIGVFDVDGVEQTFKRCYKEKWVKQRGQEEAEMVGHETHFYFNEVPLSKSEYELKVKSLISEDVIKLITNPLYFNTIKWEQRRKILLDIVGEIKDEEVLNHITTSENSNSIDELKKELLNNGKSIDEFKRQLSAKRKLLVSDLGNIPTRIDEATRNMPMVENWELVNSNISNIVSKVAELDKNIEDENLLLIKHREEVSKAHQQKHQLEIKLQVLQAKNQLESNKYATQLQNDIQTSTRLKSDIIARINDIKSNISRENNKINQLNESKALLLKQWREENAKTLTVDDASFTCPTCKQPLPQVDADVKKSELIKNFNTTKLLTIQRLKSEGEGVTNTIDSATKMVAELELALKGEQESLQKEEVKLLELKSKQTPLSSDDIQTDEELHLKKEIDSFIIPTIITVDNKELKELKQSYLIELDSLKMKLSNKEQIDKINTRISELKEQEKVIAQEISSIEKIEFIVQTFNDTKLNELNKRLISLFPNVQFKLFNTLINGGIEPTCEMMVNGVNFSDVNTAGKINAGLSIINVLVDYYNVSAPIFIDNKESINNPITCDKSQVVYLTVSNDSKLTIS